MSPSIRIKLGSLEVEYEGDEEFLRDELAEVVSDVLAGYEQSEVAVPPEIGQGDRAGSEGGVVEIGGTTANIAGRINASSGNDLIQAAAAHLTFVKGKTSFERQELIDAMRTADAYFKESYVSNLSNYLNRMVRNGLLNEPRQDVFALTPQAREELADRLA